MPIPKFLSERSLPRTVLLGAVLAGLCTQISYARNAKLCSELFSEFANHTAFDYESINLQSTVLSPEQFQKSITSLRVAPPGAILDFGPGHQFVLDRVLGEGATTIIVRTEDRKALRINKLAAQGLPGTGLAAFVLLQQKLVEGGVPVVKIDLEASHLPEFLVVEEKNIIMTLSDFNLNRPRAPLSVESMAIARKRLLEFARKTWKFVYIGDFNESQLGYDGESWFVFDLGLNNGALANHLERRTVFSALNFDGDRVQIVGSDLEKKIEGIVGEEREQRFGAGEWVDSAPTYFIRQGLGRNANDLIADDDSKQPGIYSNKPFKAGQMSARGSIPKKYLSKWARKNLKLQSNGYDGNELRFDFKKLKQVGKSSALYSIRIGETNALLEVPLVIEGKDQLFSERAPLLKQRGIRSGDLDAVGPDYVLFIEK